MPLRIVGNVALADATPQELTDKTLTSAIAKGTWTASGTWTIPAVTLGGTITVPSGLFALAGVDVNSYYVICGGPNGMGLSSKITLMGNGIDTGDIRFWTPNAAKNADIERLKIHGNLDISEVTWANVNHLPSADNTVSFGSDSYRFTLFRAVTVTSGDFKFENGWRLTEDKLYGVCLISPAGKKFRMVEV